MRRIGLLAPAALGLMLAGCGTSWGPSGNTSSQPRAPGDSMTVRRVMGLEYEAPPLGSEQGRWALRERPRATLADPDAAMQGIPEYRTGPRPDVDRNLSPTRGSSADPAAVPGIGPIATPEPVRPESPRARSTASPYPPGTVVPIPGQSPAVVTGGSDRYQTYQQPNTAGGGIIIPQGNGTGLVVGPDGRTISVPMPR